ncbi:MAG: hypothetical protein RMK52_06450 [Chitinophagales bacterium]|nr:hypothetical protein [Chitinophagales bacterium]MDW8393867.1 hypothetical protein [Chitinophagales bacterium]
MENIKIPLIVLTLAMLMQQADGQNFRPRPFVNKRLMELSVGFTGGIHVFEPVQSMYLNGAFAYCMENQIAVRADYFLFIPDPNFRGQLDRNSSLLAGGEFHFPHGRLDLSLLLQPGVAFCFLEVPGSLQRTRAEPIVRLGAETTYYLLNNAHVFVNASYLRGNYYLEGSEPYRLDELRITAGLGIQIFVNHTPVFQRKVVKF